MGERQSGWASLRQCQHSICWGTAACRAVRAGSVRNLRAPGIPSCVPACRAHEHPHLENLLIEALWKRAIRLLPVSSLQCSLLAPLTAYCLSPVGPPSEWSLVLKASWVTGIFSSLFCSPAPSWPCVTFMFVQSTQRAFDLHSSAGMLCSGF